MIFVYTNFDDTTNVLSSYAETLLRWPGVQFLRILKPPPKGSISSSIQQELVSISTNIAQELVDPRNEGVPVFFFGHGYDIPPELRGQDDKPFVGTKNPDLLRNRVLCAICCHAVQVFEPVVHGINTTIIGFRGALNVPLTSPYKESMQDCALAAPIALLANSDVQTAASKAQTAFKQLARSLFAQDDIGAFVHAGLMQDNADIVGFCGDGGRKL